MIVRSIYLKSDKNWAIRIVDFVLSKGGVSKYEQHNIDVRCRDGGMMAIPIKKLVVADKAIITGDLVRTASGAQLGDTGIGVRSFVKSVYQDVRIVGRWTLSFDLPPSGLGIIEKIISK